MVLALTSLLVSLLYNFGVTIYATRASPSQGDYSLFATCLTNAGVKPSSIVTEKDSPQIYKELNYQWQANFGNKCPMAYIVVECDQDVMTTVICAREFNIRLVPKGGGHSLEKFSFGDANSVIVDVKKLTMLKIDKNTMTATIGAGYLNSPLAWDLWEQGKVFTPYGVCPTMGVAGAATGGGVGFYVRKYGLMSDNIIEMTMVSAQGLPLVVNEHKNSDLFWALRGGVASSFGIVTKFVFKIYPAPDPTFLGILTYTPERFPELFRVWQRIVLTAPKDLAIEFDYYKDRIDMVFVDSTGQSDNFEEISKQFPPDRKESKEFLSHEEFMYRSAKVFALELFSPGYTLDVPSDLKRIERKSKDIVFRQQKVFYVNKEIDEAGIQKFYKLIDEMPRAIVIFFEAYGGAINEIPNDATAFVHRTGTLYNIVAEHRDQDLGNTTFHNEIGGYLNKFFDVGKEIFDHNASFPGFVDTGLENALQRYYGTNLPRLVEVKKKYDPNNFFNQPQSIPTELY